MLVIITAELDDAYSWLSNLSSQVYDDVATDEAFLLRLLGVPRRAAPRLAEALRLTREDSLPAIRQRLEKLPEQVWSEALGKRRNGLSQGLDDYSWGTVMRQNTPPVFSDLFMLAAYLRRELENKKTILLYAYNGTGKTRLSMAFKDAGKKRFTALFRLVIMWASRLQLPKRPEIPYISTHSLKICSIGTTI